MPQGLQALVALLVLLPGFVSARIMRAMSAQSQQSELERVIEALIFSFFTYVIYVLTFGAGFPIQWLMTADAAHNSHYVVEVHRWRVLFVALIACSLGFIWGIIRSKDLALAFLRRLKLSQRTSRESVWNDVFATLEGNVQVGLSDGRNLMGWISRYSDTGAERSLFLENAFWVAEDGGLTQVKGPGILLTEKSEIAFVMFLNTPPVSE